MAGAAQPQTARGGLLVVLFFVGAPLVGAHKGRPYTFLDDGRSGPQGRRVAGLGHVQIQPGHDVQGQQQVLGGIADAGGELAQHPLHLALLRQPGLAPTVAHVHSGHRFHEDRRAAVGNVVDDAGDAGAHLRLDEQHHPPVALGDDGLLHHLGALEAPQVALHDFVEPVLGLARFGPQASQHRAGVVQHLARRADGRADFPVEMAQLRDIAGQAGQEGQLFFAAQFVAVVAGGAGEGADGVQLLAPQQAAQQGPVNQLADVLLRPEFQRAAAVNVAAGLGGLLLTGGHFQQVLRRLQRRYLLTA